MMTKADFYIGLEFYLAASRWRRTDIGTRVIVAIRLDQEDDRRHDGPPYIVEEVVFDELAQGRCLLEMLGSLKASSEHSLCA
ncbi:MAG: hypothetical protein HYR56_04880 [Acidobacteria bacterium]|nr:hypothetical protein [Acidobacteriota bacterium]MBI3427595.1 hypothetical protein [Acidobacteriota bacterium]